MTLICNILVKLERAEKSEDLDPDKETAEKNKESHSNEQSAKKDEGIETTKKNEDSDSSEDAMEKNDDLNLNEGAARKYEDSTPDEQATEKNGDRDSDEDIAGKNEDSVPNEQASEKKEDLDSGKEVSEKNEFIDSDEKAKGKNGDQDSDEETAEKSEDSDPGKQTTERNADEQAKEKKEDVDSGEEPSEKNEDIDSDEQAAEKKEDLDSGKEASEKNEDIDSDEQAAEKKEDLDSGKEASEKNGDIDSDEKATEKKEDLDSGKEPSEKNEDIDSDEQAAEKKEDLDSGKEASEKNGDIDSDEKAKGKNGDQDSDEETAEKSEDSDPGKQATERNADLDSGKEAAEKNEDLDLDKQVEEKNEDPDPNSQATEKDEDSTVEKEEASADKLNTGKPKIQSHWDIKECPIFLRKETYQTIVAKRTKSCTIKKWIRYCNLTSLKNNVKNKEALLKHLASIETGDKRASTSIISGLVEKLNGSSIEQELELHNIDWDPREHVSVASKKLLLRTTLTRRQEHFHEGLKSCTHPISSAKPHGTQAEVSPPELLEDNSSDSSSAEEDEDTWDSPDDRSSKNEEILQSLRKSNDTVPKPSNRVTKARKTKKAAPITNKRTHELKQQNEKPATNCANCESTEGALKVLESSILRLQEDFNRQKVNMEHLAKKLLEQQNNKDRQDQLRSKPKDDVNSIKKSFEDKTKTIFDTINVQQTCLDQITDSITKNEKTVAKLKNRIESTVTTNQKVHDQYKNELLVIRESLQKSEKENAEIRKQLEASTQIHQPFESDSTRKSQTPKSENLINQLKNMNSKLDSVSERIQQTHLTQKAPESAHMSMLLFMLSAVWNENKELKKKVMDPNHKQDTGATTKNGMQRAFKPVDFLIVEEEIETNTKVERLDHRKRKRNPINSDKKEVKATLPTNLSRAAQNLEPPVPKAAYKVHNDNKSTKTKKGLLDTPKNQLMSVSAKPDKVNPTSVAQDRDFSVPTATTRGNSSVKETKKGLLDTPNNERKPQQEPHGKPVQSRQTNGQENRKVTKILKPMSRNDAFHRQSTKYTLTQGMRNSVQKEKLQAGGAISSTNGQRDSMDPKTVVLNNNNNESSCVSEDETSEKTVTNAERYRTRKCLMVHDPFLKHFDATRFSQWFDVTSIQYHSISEILNKGSLISKINALTPEVVYLHIGFGDLLNKTEGDSITDMYKQLIYKLLESTKAKICISLMIPVLGYPKTNSKLKQINKIVSDFITQLRNQPKYGKRIFTSNNDALGGFINRTTGLHGVTVALNERGQKNLWIKLRDCLQRSLGHVPPRTNKNKTEYPSNNRHYE